VHLSRHNRQVATKALKRITNLKLSQAFDWWRSQIAVLQGARARVGHIIAHMQNRCVATAFQSWADAVANSKEAAARRTQMVDAAVTRSNATLLGQMFVVRLPLQCKCKRHTLYVSAQSNMCHGPAWVLMFQNQMIVNPQLAHKVPVCCLLQFNCILTHLWACSYIHVHVQGWH